MLTDPYAIFAAAQQRWLSAVYPAHLTYGIAVSVSKNGVTSQAHYHAVYDSEQNRVTINAVSDEELAHPYTPHGINFFFSLPLGGKVPMSAPQHTFDYLGVPMLAPNYSFGIVPNAAPNTTPSDADLVKQIRAQFHDPAPKRKPVASGSLKTIATEAVARRRYAITLAGMQPLSGHVDYHLLLKPLENPGMYRLREMWIETATYVTDRIVTDGDFTAASLGGVRWQTDFVQIAGATFIESESALSGFTLDRRSYDNASVAFTNIAAIRAGAPFATLPRFATSTDTAPPVLAEPLKPRV